MERAAGHGEVGVVLEGAVERVQEGPTVVAVGAPGVLAVDDEPPALDELAYLLARRSEVGEVVRAGDATAALRELADHRVDAIFLDINMPGLSGLELAGVLAKYASPPAIVFVTAHDDRAVDAFEVGAVDYLLKSVSAERLGAALGAMGAVAAEFADDGIAANALWPETTIATAAVAQPAERTVRLGG